MSSGSSTRFADRPEGDDVARLKGRVAELEGLLDNVDGIVWEADPSDFRYRYVSRRAETLLGYPIRQWTEDSGFWLDHLHPADREWAPTYRYSAARSGQDHRFEFRMIASDGRTVWLRDLVRPGTDPSGRPTLRGLMVDVTDERHVEELAERRNSALLELARSESLKAGQFDQFARLAIRIVAEVLDVERIGVWLFSPDRSVLRCAWLYERTPDRCQAGPELQAAAYPRYFAALSKGRFVAADDASNDPRTSEFAEGYLRPLGISSMLDAPLLRGSELIGVVCHEHVGPPRRWIHDEREFAASVAEYVSHALESQQRRQAEEEVRASQQSLLEQRSREKERVEQELARTRERLVLQARLGAIGRIAASIAHELRNPLGSIRNASFYLKRYTPDLGDRGSRHLGIIEQEVNAADAIISDLLEMTKAKSPVKMRVDLESVVREAFEHLPTGEMIRLELSIGPEVREVTADGGQLKQVMVNLLMNAMQAMEGAGTVRVDARRVEGDVSIAVTDDGPGVRPDDRERIFEPLYTTRAKGTGLGLPVCRQIVEAHGGSVDVLDGPSGGARFEIRLPMHPERDGETS